MPKALPALRKESLSLLINSVLRRQKHIALSVFSRADKELSAINISIIIKENRKLKTVKNTKKIWIALAIVAVAGIAIAARFLTGHDTAQYFTEKVDRGEVRDVVEATGTINAVTTVQVGSQVSGTIATLGADFNSHVKKGQIIAQIDPSLFDGALLQAKADLETARANAAAGKANLEKAKAAEAQARADYERTRPLAAQGVLSQQQLDVSKANEDSARAAIAAAEAEVLQANAQVSQKAA